LARPVVAIKAATADVNRTDFIISSLEHWFN
jgi:hypothetical protein